MMTWNNLLEDAHAVCITGHTKPDGDCIGSCLGLRNYLSDCWPHLKADVYLDEYPAVYEYMRYENEVLHREKEGVSYDLFIALDCASLDRIGTGRSYFASATRTVCIDHHISNEGYAGTNLIVSEASATAEILYGLFDKEKISRQTAECLYTGIAHDTGIFKYSNVTGNTMRAAADLIDRGIDFYWILNHTILEKEYKQNRFSGFCLYQSSRILDGLCVWSGVSREQMDELGVTASETNGIVEKLRDTKGADCAFFLYETEPQVYKVSMRSKAKIDVSRICVRFGGGGHVRAAGCTMSGTPEQIMEQIAAEIQKQLQ